MANTMVHTSSGTLYFDATLHVDHNSSVTVTEHAVQTGAVISDHAIVDPQEISLEIGMTDTKGGDGSSAQAYQQFLSVMKQREPCTVVTRLGTYQNMVLTSISAPDDYTTMKALKATLIFKQVRIVSVATVKIQDAVSGSKPSTGSPSQPATPETQKPETPSEKKPEEKKQSVLKQATQKQYSTTINADTVKKAVTAVTSAVSSVVTGAVNALKNAVKTAAASNAAKTAATQTTSKATTTATKPVAAKVASLTSAKALASKAVSLLKS